MKKKLSRRSMLAQQFLDDEMSRIRERAMRMGNALDRANERMGITEDFGSIPLWMEGPHLKKIREEAGASQQQLAQLTGITRGVIANYESDVTVPTIDSALKIHLVLQALGSAGAARSLLEIFRWEKAINEASLEVMNEELKVLHLARTKITKRMAEVRTLERDLSAALKKEDDKKNAG